MTRMELGRRPLLVDIINRSVNFINHIKSNTELLVNQSLIYEGNSHDESNILQLIRKYMPQNIVNTASKTDGKSGPV